MELERLLVQADIDLAAALRAIDANGQGLVFVVDAGRQLLGVVTDGDARRALMAGRHLTTPVVEVMNPRPASMPVESPTGDVLTRLRRRGGIGGFTHLPLLDANGRVVDYASVFRAHRVPIAAPELSGNELSYVVDCIRTGWISSQGSYIRDFESAFAAFCGAPHAVAVSNGTVALHLALVTLGVGPGDEVIVPDFTFAASINAVLHAGATPVIVDVDRDTWTIDPARVAAAVTAKTTAIMPVHLYGQPCSMDALEEIARTHDLWILEDCAEALGSSYRGRRVGTLGDAAAFSFFGNKTITTGEGGMLVFTDGELASRARRLRDHGMSPQRRYWHEEVGFNYRMTNLQGAIGLAQIERIDDFLLRKRRLSAAYDAALADVSGIAVRQPPDWSDSVCWLYSCLVEPAAPLTRDELIERLQLAGIESRPVFYPLHEMPPYQRFSTGASLPVTTDISRRAISLPSAVGMREEDQAAVAQAVRGILSLRRLVPSA
ncbi:MAG: aminotransferase class I/II-fold pyridoxal phosphate-dependent enzyme [Vicinamibacterales bacterium]